MKPLRMVVGLLVWVGLVALLFFAMNRNVASQDRQGQADLIPALWSHTFAHHPRAKLTMDADTWTSVGDPVFIIHDANRFTQIGEIESVGEVTGERALYGSYVREAVAKFYPHAPLIGAGATLTFYETPFSTEWIINTLLPPDRRKAAIEDLRLTFEAHSDEILAALRPIVEDTLRDAVMVVEADLPKVLAKHEDQLAALGAKYQTQIIEKKLIPLIKEELFPIAVARGKPVATAIGQKLWDRVSVWRFGVRFLWDRTPFADGENVKREWERFLKDDAVPVLEAHSGELVKMMQDIVSDAATNKKVVAVFRESIAQVVEDKDLQKTIWSILREAVLENPRVHAVVDRHWRSDRARAAFNLAGDRLEGTIIRIGDMILGTKEAGITPQLARVLRYRLLHKDSRFYVLEAGSGPATEPLVLPVKQGGEPKVHPFVAEK